MLRLHVVPAQGDPYDQALEEDEVVVGRSSQCQVTIADRFLSRRHARLHRREDGWCIEDLGSRNGTLVNGRVIEGMESLAAGDEIQISGSLLRVLPEFPDVGILTSERGLPGHTVFRPASDLLVSQGAIAPTERSSVDALQRYSDRLQLLNDLHQALSRPMALDELLKMILLRAFEDLRPEDGVILLKDGQGGYRQAAHRSAEESTEPYLISETLVREVVEKGLAALVLDVETDERFGAAESIIGSGIRSLIASPLQDEEGTLGMIALSSRLHRRQFKDEDLELLTTLGSIAAMRIRNVALAEEAVERRRLATELKLARQIQVALLPDRLPTIPGWEIYAATVPSRGVSGDFYEVLERGDGRECVLIITDVSGKGIGASLLTASLEALLIDPIETGHPPDAICARVGRRLFQRTPPNKYATAIIGALDPPSGRLQYTNAGHNHALLIRSGGEIELLGPTGTPLGLLPNSEYTAAETSMRPGDTLLLYTDGITEAANPVGEEYGLERLAELCRRHRFESLDELAQTIESELDDFVEGVPYADDRTVVLARRSEGDLS